MSFIIRRVQRRRQSYDSYLNALQKARGTLAPFLSLVKHNRLIPTHKHALFHHELQRLREHNLLNILAGLGHVVGAVRVADGDDVLGDDRAFVEGLSESLNT